MSAVSVEIDARDDPLIIQAEFVALEQEMAAVVIPRSGTVLSL